jgi:excisionase family DNA binding protein
MDEESCRCKRTACAGGLGDRGHGFEQARPGPGTAAHPGSFERPVASEGHGKIPAWAVQPRWGDQSNDQPRRYARPCSGSAVRTDDSRPVALTALMTVAEAAAVLRVSTKTIRRLIARGALGRVKIGRALRLRSVDLDRYILDRLDV